MDPAIDDDAPKQVDAEKAWLVDRRSAITATDVPAILGLSPFSSPIKVWRSKTGDSEDQADSEAMYYGRLFERPILTAYEKRTSNALIYPEPFRMVRSADVPLIGATLDAQRADNLAPVDAKNVGFRTEVYGEEGTDDFPLHYAAQLMIQMFVTGTRSAHLAVLFSRYDLKIYNLEYDEITAEGLVSRAIDWHERYVVGKVPPPVDGTADYTAFVKRIKQASQMILHAEPRHEEWALQLKTTKEQLAAIEMEKSRLDNLFRNEIGEARGIEGTKWRALWSQEKDSVGPDLEKVALYIAERYLEACALDGIEEDQPLGQRARTVVDQLLNRPDMQRITRRGSRKFTFNYKGE